MIAYQSITPSLKRWLSEPVFDIMVSVSDAHELQMLEALVTHRLPVDLPDAMFNNLRTTDKVVFFHTVKELLFHVLTQAEWYDVIEKVDNPSEPPPMKRLMTYKDVPVSAFKSAVTPRVFDTIMRDATPREQESVQILIDHIDKMPYNDDVRSVYVGYRLMKLPLSIKDTTFFFYGVNMLLYQVLTPAEMRDLFLRTAKEDTIADNLSGNKSPDEIDKVNEARVKAEQAIKEAKDAEVKAVWKTAILKTLTTALDVMWTIIKTVLSLPYVGPAVTLWALHKIGLDQWLLSMTYNRLPGWFRNGIESAQDGVRQTIRQTIRQNMEYMMEPEVPSGPPEFEDALARFRDDFGENAEFDRLWAEQYGLTEQEYADGMAANEPNQVADIDAQEYAEISDKTIQDLIQDLHQSYGVESKDEEKYANDSFEAEDDDVWREIEVEEGEELELMNEMTARVNERAAERNELFNTRRGGLGQESETDLLSRRLQLESRDQLSAVEREELASLRAELRFREFQGDLFRDIALDDVDIVSVDILAENLEMVEESIGVDQATFISSEILSMGAMAAGLAIGFGIAVYAMIRDNQNEQDAIDDINAKNKEFDRELSELLKLLDATDVVLPHQLFTYRTGGLLLGSNVTTKLSQRDLLGEYTLKYLQWRANAKLKGGVSYTTPTVQESLDFLGTIYRTKITPGPLILTTNNTQPSDILHSDNVADYNKTHPHERIDVFNNTWQHFIQNYSTLYSYNVTTHFDFLNTALIEYIGKHVVMVPSFKNLPTLLPPLSIPIGTPKAVLSELDWFTYWAKSITAGETMKSSKAVRVFDEMMPVVSHSLNAVLVESNASLIEVSNLQIMDKFINLHVEIDDVIQQCTSLDEEVNMTGNISGTTKINISRAGLLVDADEPYSSAPGIVETFVETFVETLYLWYDQANKVAKGFIRYGASTVLMWYDPTLSRKTNLAVMSSAVLTASMAIMPKKTIGGLIAAISYTLSAGLSVVERGMSVGTQAATVMMPIVKDAGRAIWENGGKGLVQGVVQGVVQDIPAYLVGMIGSTMKYILMVGVKHPIGLPVLTAGISISAMFSERVYTFLYVKVPASISKEDADHVTQAAINVMRGGASLLGSGGKVLEEVSTSISDAIVQTKATIGSAAFGYTAAAFLGVIVSLYIGLESNRMKSDTLKRRPTKRIKRI